MTVPGAHSHGDSDRRRAYDSCAQYHDMARQHTRHSGQQDTASALNRPEIMGRPAQQDGRQSSLIGRSIGRL